MRVILAACAAAGIIWSVASSGAAAFPADAAVAMAQATAADKPAANKKKSKRKRAPKADYLRAVTGR
jgi:hypothetical protein